MKTFQYNNLFLLLFETNAAFFFKQLFRRVAAALPGMENTTEKPNKDLVEVKLKDTPQENAQQEGGCWCQL